jgi:glycosyltransferase involved in cell wall biosynthesis
MSTKAEPKVTVIMPMKNAADFVEDAVKSVLSQDYGDFEMIIVDDGSTDNSRELVENLKSKKVSVISGPETGAADAFNLALSLAKGEYVCNCDADDLFPDDRLSWQVDWLELNGGSDAVCGTYSTMDNKGNILSMYDCGSSPMEINPELEKGVVRTSFCTFLMRTASLKKLGGYRSYFISSYDIDLQLRMGEACKIWYEPKNSYYYRLHDSSITHTQASNKRVFFEETARAFLQQRKLSGIDALDNGSPPALPNFDEKASSSLNQVTGVLISEAWRLHRSGLKHAGVQKGWQACRHAPTSFVNWKNLFFLILK